jgi:hypothetical protein
MSQAVNTVLSVPNPVPLIVIYYFKIGLAEVGEQEVTVGIPAAI